MILIKKKSICWILKVAIIMYIEIQIETVFNVVK